MTAKKFTIISVLALLGMAGVFSIPDSAWWDSRATTPRILFGISVSALLYVGYTIIKGLTASATKEN